MWEHLIEGLAEDDAPFRLMPETRTPLRLRRTKPAITRSPLYVPTLLRPCVPGIKNVQIIHDCIKELTYPAVKALPIVARRKWILGRASKIIAVSQSTLDDIALLYGDSIAERTAVIYNPVRVNVIKRLASIQDTPGLFKKWLSGAPYCVFIGTRAGTKNFSECRTLLAADKDIKLALVGPPPSPQEPHDFQAYAGRLCFLGQLTDNQMFPLLAQSEFLFFPSTKEGFGLPIVESLSVGTPVIGLQTKSNIEVSHDDTILFERQGVSSFGDILCPLKVESRDFERCRDVC